MVHTQLRARGIDDAAVLRAMGAVPRDAALVEQLAVGGRLVIPIGGAWRDATLKVVTRTEGGPTVADTIGVRFVPLRHPDHSLSSK